MVNLLKFNDELISNGLDAMSLDYKCSKMLGNVLHTVLPLFSDQVKGVTFKLVYVTTDSLFRCKTSK